MTESGGPSQNSDKTSLKEIILASGLSFVLVLIILLILSQRFRCVLEYRMNDARAALIVVALGGVGTLLTRIRAPRRVPDVLWYCMLGGASALLLCLLVAIIFLPPPLESDCPYVFAPTPTATSSFTPTSTSTPAMAAIVTPDSTPTPTNTLVVPPTDTSTPEPPTNTPKSMDTSTPAPTDTPFPNTSTPMLTVTPTPTPIPDAIVNAEALNLRSGPGTIYDVLGLLKQGDPLKVTGKNLASDWLKVIAPDGQEGWTARSLLQVNVDMAGVPVAQAPPTPTPMYTSTPTATPTPPYIAPILLAPKDGETFTGWVSLEWQWEGQLKEKEYFSVRVWKEGEEDSCHHTQVKEREYSGGLSFCAHDGKHYWSVAVVEKTEEGPPPVWENRSKDSARRWFYFTPGGGKDEPWEPPPPPEPDGKATPPPP